MMWYPIPGWPGYRINHHAEVLSLGAQGGPQVLKTTKNMQVKLHRDGKTQLLWVYDLMELAGLQVYSDKKRPLHHEAARQFCDQGHEFTPENTMRRESRGRVIRKCKRCHAEAMARYRTRKRAGLV